MFCFGVSAERVLSAHPALRLHGRPGQSSPQRPAAFTAAFPPSTLWFEPGSSGAHVPGSCSSSLATEVLVTASETASLLHGLRVLIHHSARERLGCACGDAENVQDADNTTIVYYIYLPSLEKCLSWSVHSSLLSGCVLDNPLVYACAFSGGVFIL